MFDFGFDKFALIAVVALVVIGPQRLPRVARTIGHFLGKAQRYVADVKAEVNHAIELDELKKMKSQIEQASTHFEQNFHQELNEVRSPLIDALSEVESASGLHTDYQQEVYTDEGYCDYDAKRSRKRKNWRLKRSVMPLWYKHRHGVRLRVQSGAARVARFRPHGRNP